jgi:hypothetical protein
MSDETNWSEARRAGRFTGGFQLLLDRIQYNDRRREVEKPPYDTTRLRLRLNLEHAIPRDNDEHVKEVIGTRVDATIVVRDDALPKTLAWLRRLVTAKTRGHLIPKVSPPLKRSGASGAFFFGRARPKSVADSRSALARQAARSMEVSLRAAKTGRPPARQSDGGRSRFRAGTTVRGPARTEGGDADGSNSRSIGRASLPQDRKPCA